MLRRGRQLLGSEHCPTASSAVVAEGYHSHLVVWRTFAKMAPCLLGFGCNRGPAIAVSLGRRSDSRTTSPRWENATRPMLTDEEQTAMPPTTYLRRERAVLGDATGARDQLAGSDQLLWQRVKGEEMVASISNVTRQSSLCARL